MTQRDFNLAIARATGESVRTINNMGFVPLTAYPVEREPLMVDWDELDRQRTSILPQRQRELTAA
jgi:hypothetical protein